MAEKPTSQVEDVHGSGIYPATGPFPKGPATVRSPAALAHPEERQAAGLQSPRLETATLVIGRVIFGGYFFYNGLNHFLSRKALAEYTRSKGVPSPDLAVAASGLLALAGSRASSRAHSPRWGRG